MFTSGYRGWPFSKDTAEEASCRSKWNEGNLFVLIRGINKQHLLSTTVVLTMRLGSERLLRGSISFNYHFVNSRFQSLKSQQFYSSRKIISFTS